MQTPVLTKKQLKSTLSAKKNRPKETLKNVLAVPYNTDFWPEISPEDHQYLLKILVEHLPCVKKQKITVHWDEIKDVPKEERKNYQKKVAKDVPEPQPKIPVRLGVNDVSKLLDNNSCGAVLISADVQPRIMVQHILDKCVLYKVPVIVFDKLKKLLLKQCGISSAAIAIEKNIAPDSTLNLIKESMERIFAKYPIPENHINYNRSLDLDKEPEREEKECKKEELKVDETEIRKSVYLVRPASGRAFVPKENVQPQKKVLVLPMEVDESGFIPFSEEPNIEQPNNSSNYKYKSLVVKRLKGNKNRHKRKIEQLKKKERM